MPILHVIIMLITHALLAIFLTSIPWTFVIGTLAITLLIIIAVYRIPYRRA